jgi:hypothetical protein
MSWTNETLMGNHPLTLGHPGRQDQDPKGRRDPMGKRNVIVGPAGPGKWTVKQPGSKEPISSHRTQGAAIERAKPITRKNESEVIIQSRDGQFRSKDSYGPDPNPPKDKEH